MSAGTQKPIASGRAHQEQNTFSRSMSDTGLPQAYPQDSGLMTHLYSRGGFKRPLATALSRVDHRRISRCDARYQEKALHEKSKEVSYKWL